MPAPRHPEAVPCWDVFELTLDGPSEGNPFSEVELSGRFTYNRRSVEVDGFYDGGCTYCVRFMPDTQGEWRYQTAANCPELEGAEGSWDMTINTLEGTYSGEFTIELPAKPHMAVRLRRA